MLTVKNGNIIALIYETLEQLLIQFFNFIRNFDAFNAGEPVQNFFFIVQISCGQDKFAIIKASICLKAGTTRQLTVVYYWLLTAEVYQSGKGRNAVLFCQFFVTCFNERYLELVAVIVDVLQLLQC